MNALDSGYGQAAQQTDKWHCYQLYNPDRFNQCSILRICPRVIELIARTIESGWPAERGANLTSGAESELSGQIGARNVVYLHRIHEDHTKHPSDELAALAALAAA